jgi:transcriptional regulator with XRE-family HTH domain
MNLYALIPEQVDHHRIPSGLDNLLRRLRMAHREAGHPTYRQLGKQIGMSASTICRIFNATKPPPWHQLQQILGALQVSEEDIDTTWRTLWRRAENAAKPIPVELDPDLTVPGSDHCPACGVWLADAKIHGDLHRRLEILEQLIQQLTSEL